MNPGIKLALAYSSLLGEFTGSLEGLLHYITDEDVKERMRKRVDELRSDTISQDYINKLSFDFDDYMLKEHGIIIK